MTTRLAWDDLPTAAKQAVEDRIGQVLKTESTPGGRNSELSETLWTDQGPVFCKGISTDSPISYMHRNEIAVNPFLPAGLAPRLLWHVETVGWLLLGYEHLSGRHADLSSGSEDLPLVAEAVTRIGEVVDLPTSGVQRSMSDRWGHALTRELTSSPFTTSDPWCAANAGLLVELANRAPSYMDGSSLIHSDLNPTNIVVSDRAQVVDWAWWQIGRRGSTRHTWSSASSLRATTRNRQRAGHSSSTASHRPRPRRSPRSLLPRSACGSEGSPAPHRSRTSCSPVGAPPQSVTGVDLDG